MLWSALKNKRVKLTRGAGFEEVLKGKLIEIEDHPKKSQEILLIDYQNYVWVIPFVRMAENQIFLKTMYPSRKYTKRYRKEGLL